MPNPDAIERIAPGLATLVHPGDDDTPPFPLTLPVFQTATLPDGMAEADAAELGMPSPDIAKHFLEAVLHLAEVKGYELVESVELADLRAAAVANEGRRNEIKQFYTTCDAPLFRLMVDGFDTDHPRIPCQVIEAMQGKSTDCKTKHQAAQ